MSNLWVKFEGNNAVKVSTEGCLDVDDFIKTGKKEVTIPDNLKIADIYKSNIDQRLALDTWLFSNFDYSLEGAKLLMSSDL